VPHGYAGDATEAIIAQIERFAPGFRDRIIGTAVRRPRRWRSTTRTTSAATSSPAPRTSASSSSGHAPRSRPTTSAFPGCTCARRPPRPGRARTGCAGRIVHQCRAEHVRPGTQVEFAMDRGLGVRRGRRDPDLGDVVPVQDRRHRPVGAEHRIAHRRLGGRLHVLRKIAGHGSLSTTQRYLHPDRQSIADAGEKLSSHLRAQAEELAEVSGDGPASCEQSRPAM